MYKINTGRKKKVRNELEKQEAFEMVKIFIWGLEKKKIASLSRRRSGNHRHYNKEKNREEHQRVDGNDEGEAAKMKTNEKETIVCAALSDNRCKKKIERKIRFGNNRVDNVFALPTASKNVSMFLFGFCFKSQKTDPL